MNLGGCNSNKTPFISWINAFTKLTAIRISMYTLMRRAI